jgi:DHA1 family inner membrane transport protein
VLGVPVGSYIGYTFGWMWVFLAVAAGALALAVALLLRAPGRIGIAPATLADLIGTLTDIRLAIAILLTVTVMSSAWAPYTFLAPIIEEKTGAGPETVGVLLVIYGLGSVAGNALGGFLTDRVGAVKALAVATAGPPPFMAALTGMAWDPWLGAALLFGWSAVGWAVAVPQQTRLVSLDPARTQVLLALNAASIYLGAAIGSSVGGFAKSVGGIPALGVAGVAFGLLALAHLALTVRLGGRRDRGGRDY